VASIAVVGAGLAGLAAAWTLERAGADVVLYEASGRVGGVVRTERVDGFLAELGPTSMSPPSGPASALLDEAGLGSELVTAAPTARRRYIVHRGRLVALPLSPPALMASPLLSFTTKLRVLAEPFARGAPLEEETVAAFARRRLGRQAGAFAELATTGIFAGDPSRLSARYALPRLTAMEAQDGSLLRGLRARHRHGTTPRTISAPRHGMATIAERLAAGVARLRCDRAVTGIRRDGRGWTVELRTAGGREQAQHDALLLAVPAHAYAVIAWPDELWSLGALAEIAHAPVAVLALGFRCEDVGHPLDGFGVLAPAAEGLGVLGIIFSSSLFPDRAPDGHVLVTVLAGGVRQPELAALDADALEARVRNDVARLLDVRGAPVFRRGARWPHAIPQPEVGHGRYLALADDAERAVPTIALAGSWRDGVAVGDALASGIAAAHRLSDRLTTSIAPAGATA
jgi:oxygen-dependent protoporphyrinogen oxidase